MSDPQNPASTPDPDGSSTPPPAGGTPPAAGSTPPAAPTPPPAASATPPAYEAPAYPSAPQYTAAPQYQGGQPMPGAPIPGKTMGIVAFVLSFFAQVIALVLGIIALVQSKKAGHKNGFALAAIIISSVIIVIGTILLILFFTVFATASTGLYDQYVDNCLTIGGSGYVEIFGERVPCEEIDTNDLD